MRAKFDEWKLKITDIKSSLRDLKYGRVLLYLLDEEEKDYIQLSSHQILRHSDLIRVFLERSKPNNLSWMLSEMRNQI